MLFEFSVQKTFSQSIDIVDIGNTALKCSNGILNYYIIIKTVMGKTSILKFGPIIFDLETLVDDFSVNYKKIDYKETVISKEINKFINDYKKAIETVEEITEYEAWQDFPKIKQFYENV